MSAAPAGHAEWSRFTFTESAMGTRARLELYASSEAQARTAAEAAFARIAELEQVASDYRPSSELMRLCAAPSGKPVPLSGDLYRLLTHARRIAEETDGAFDPTVGPLVRLWREARRTARLPDPSAIRDAKARVGWRYLDLDPKGRTATLRRSGMRLDLGGIAKGDAADEVLRAMRAKGVTRALLEFGGDLRLGDPPPGQAGWRIEMPNLGETRTLANVAVSSSGDTEQYVEIGGVRYSHVVNPKTGYGLTFRHQATVIAPSGLLADPLSTALTVLDERGRLSLLLRYPRVQAVVRAGASGPSTPAP